VAREDPPRVLMVTGYDSTGLGQHAGVELLMKPFRPSVLLRKVRELLDLSGPVNTTE